MWSSEVVQMIIRGIGESLYMTLAATLFGYVLGLPWGVVLAVTDADGIKPNRPVYRVLDFITNIMRSIPFLILLILIIPLTRLIVGKSYGSTATIVPLVVSAAPFIARMVESSLKEVDKGVIEAAQSMGADHFQIIVHLSGHDSRIFRYGRNRWRGRTGLHCHSVRLLPVPGRYYDRNSGPACADPADFPADRDDDRFQDRQEKGLMTIFFHRRRENVCPAE